MADKKSFWDSNFIKVVAGIAAIIAIVEILGKLFGKSQGDKDAEQAAQNVRIENRELYEKIPPSYAESVYRDWGNILDTALIKNANENETAVFKVFQQVKNLSDIKKLITYFGLRRSVYHPTKMTLPQAISELLNDKELEKLNSILAKKKINYRFY